MNCPFDAPESLYYAEGRIAAGTHVFTLDSGKYEFTTTQAVPEGGQVYIHTWTDYVPGKSYDIRRRQNDCN